MPVPVIKCVSNCVRLRAKKGEREYVCVLVHVFLIPDTADSYESKGCLFVRSCVWHPAFVAPTVFNLRSAFELECFCQAANPAWQAQNSLPFH